MDTSASLFLRAPKSGYGSYGGSKSADSMESGFLSMVPI